MGFVELDLSRASEALRTELIFLPDDGRVSRVDGGFRILTPSNPGYWWGNSLRMDAPPRDADFDRWMRLFEREVHAVQPSSTHRTFGWNGREAGAIERFVAAGFEHFVTIGTAADRGDAVVSPHPNRSAPVCTVDGDDWDALVALEVATRESKHSEASYTEFISRRVDGWRRLQAAGQGEWFCIWRDGRIVSALGIFAEARRGADGRRFGRFQHVATHPSARREGWAGTLVEHASRFAFERFDVDSIWIMADANDVARRVYESCGYRVRSTHHGLERGD